VEYVQKYIPLHVHVRVNLQNRCLVQNERTYKLSPKVFGNSYSCHYNYIIKRDNNMLKPYSTIQQLQCSKKSRSMMCLLNCFPEPSSVLASTFHHFEPYNNFAIRCIVISTPWHIYQSCSTLNI
jgi:hypothetical protein